MPITIHESEIEEFLVDNWQHIFNFRFLERQKETEIGIIDILGYDDEKHEYVVIEIKTDDCDDSTVGQIQRYMGWIAKTLCKKPERVRGLIFTREVSKSLECALSVIPNVELYVYQLQPRIFKIKRNVELENENIGYEGLGDYFIAKKDPNLFYEFKQYPEKETAPDMVIVFRDGAEIKRVAVDDIDYENPWRLVHSGIAELGDEIHVISNRKRIAQMTICNK